ncbi:MAG: hypothetical protein R3Y47_11380 [Lachnospiraceae bacterium]
MNELLFEEAKQKVFALEQVKKGVGTLSEKTVHAVVKNYCEPDVTKQEIKIDSMIVDIFTGTEIMEIQTRSFDKMRKKLSKLLSMYKVTIVFPVPKEKKLIWIDEETGEYSKSRKSPIKGNEYFVFPELYKIKQFLKDENLCIKVLLIDMEEYRLLNGYSKDKKKGSERFDRIPQRLVEEIDITCKEDYMMFVPAELEEPFSSKEYAKAAHIKVAMARICLNILFDLGIVERVGKSGRSYLYSCEDNRL